MFKHCLYTYHKNDIISYIIIYVDDILIAANHQKHITTFENEVKQQFIIINLGKVGNYLLSF